MKNFWVSFWAAREFGAFEIHSPWWFSGYRFKPGTKLDDIDDEDTTESSVCAAVRSGSLDEVVIERFFRRFGVPRWEEPRVSIDSRDFVPSIELHCRDFYPFERWLKERGFFITELAWEAPLEPDPANEFPVRIAFKVVGYDEPNVLANYHKLSRDLDDLRYALWP